MKALILAALACCALAQQPTVGRASRFSAQVSAPSAVSAAQKPRVSRVLIEQVEQSLDRKLQGLWAGDPIGGEVLGLTQGAYIHGVGAVFMSEVNLAVVAGITPFHPAITADEIKRTHDKKMQRLVQVRDALRGMLVDSAATLDSIPSDEQVAVGVSFFYWKSESREGLPSQIVMHAPKKVLLQVKTGAAGKEAIASDEF